MGILAVVFLHILPVGDEADAGLGHGVAEIIEHGQLICMRGNQRYAMRRTDVFNLLLRGAVLRRMCSDIPISRSLRLLAWM